MARSTTAVSVCPLIRPTNSRMNFVFGSSLRDSDSVFDPRSFFTVIVPSRPVLSPLYMYCYCNTRGISVTLRVKLGDVTPLRQGAALDRDAGYSLPPLEPNDGQIDRHQGSVLASEGPA